MNDILRKRIETEAEQNWMMSGAFEAGAEFALSHQWISVDEALPEPGEEVILFNKKSIRHYEIGWLRKEKGYSKSKWTLTNGFVEDEDITRWMPIPKFEPIK